MSLALSNRDAAQTISDQQVYRLLFAATFLVFLTATVAVRLFRRVQGRARPAGARRSLFAEAKATGYSTLALAFMG